MKDTIKSIIAIVIYALVMYILSDFLISKLYINICEKILNKNVDSMSVGQLTYINIIYDLIIYIILFIPLIFIFKPNIKQDFLSFKEDNKFFTEYTFKGIAIFYASNILVSIINYFIKIEDSVNQTTIETLASYSLFSGIILSLAVCILGPIVEELIFRKALGEIIKNKVLFVIISTIIFASIHLITSRGSFKEILVLSIPYVTSGLVFSLLYVYGRKNILVTTIIHMVSNTISMILIMFQ